MSAPAHDVVGDQYELVPVGLVDTNPDQVRTVFDPDELDGLAQSIDQVGLLQPVVVRRTGDRYQLIMGERRLRAVTQLGWQTIPAVVRQTGDSDLRIEALTENLQRADLNPLETAAAYQALMEELGCNSEELAKRLGVSYGTIRFHIRALELPAGVQRRLAAGVITMAHAKALMSLPSESDLVERFADRIVTEGWTVRDLHERIIEVKNLPAFGGEGDAPSARAARPPKRQGQSQLLAEWQTRLEARLETQVRVSGSDKGGRVTIRYADAADLRRLAGVLGVPLSE